VAATNVGDIADMVPRSAAEFLVAAEDEDGLTAVLDRLAADRSLRSALGAANRAKVRGEFNEATMISRYARLYGEAIGVADAFVPPSI
jgi:glycosyltransferase involved in cell wall biosynthesis